MIEGAPSWQNMHTTQVWTHSANSISPVVGGKQIYWRSPFRKRELFFFIFKRNVSTVKYFLFGGVTSTGKQVLEKIVLHGNWESPAYLVELIFQPIFSISQSHSWLNTHPQFTVFSADFSWNANSANILLTSSKIPSTSPKHTRTPTNAKIYQPLHYLYFRVTKCQMG